MILLFLGSLLATSMNGNRISKMTSELAVDNTGTNTDFDKLDTTTFEAYPVLVPPNWVLQICLKDTLLLEKLLDHISDCNNFPCMFSKIIEDESMKSMASILKHDTMDNISQEFRQSVQDCMIWWKLFKQFEKNTNPRRELGRCLFQTFSSRCREPVLDKIRLLLITAEET